MVEHTNQAPTRRWVRWLTLLGSASFITLWAPSCLYDDSKRCGDDMKLGESERCVCPEGSIYSPTGCVKCGDHQIAQGPMCVCEEGYAFGADGVTCQEDMGSGGTSTSAGGNTSTSGGSGGAAGGGGEGGDDTDGGENSSGTTTETVTSSTTGSAPECTVNEDCAVTQICDAGACRLPTGWGTACTVGGTECAGFESDFCDTFQSMCTVSNCSNVPDTCPAGYDCCDLTGPPLSLTIMCIPTGPYCATPAP